MDHKNKKKEIVENSQREKKPLDVKVTHRFTEKKKGNRINREQSCDLDFQTQK